MKKILSTLLMAIMLIVSCLSLTACGEDLVDVKLNFKVGNDKTVTVKYTLYRHLAEESVDQFVDLAEDGYFNNVFMYRTDLEGAGGAVMFGQYKFDEHGKIISNAEVPTIKGEFPKGGVVGSDLKANKGNMCVWRWWDAGSSLDYSGFNTGSCGNIVIPSTSGLFSDAQSGGTTVAVFGVFDEDSKNDLFDLINSDDEIWSDADEYHVFYIKNGNAIEQVILTKADYEKMVEDGVYTIEETVNGDVVSTDYDILDPADEDDSVYKSIKYKATKITVPKAENRIVLTSINIG